MNDMANEDEKKAIFDYISRAVSDIARKCGCDNKDVWCAMKEVAEKEMAEKEPEFKPKFSAGDWITDGCQTRHIVEIDIYNNKYVFDGNVYSEVFSYTDKNFHIWNMNDARDGDVLACNISYYDNPFVCIFKRINKTCDDGYFDSHCYVTASRKEYDRFFVCRDNDDRVDACVGHSCQDIHPATDYEKKLLFDKMREAGYEWDAEKKELKKIEQNPVEPQQDMLSQEQYAKAVDECVFGEQKPAWSEEDEKIRSSIINFIRYELNHKAYIGTAGVDSARQIEWLKSIRPQNTWKPSDEQMQALANALSLAKNCGEESAFDLRTLYEQLKKL